MSNETISTQLRICPFLSPVVTSTLAGPDGSPPGGKLFPVQCLGPACQQWRHDERMPPETGDCGIALTALFTATTVAQIGELANITGDVVNNIVELAKVVKHVAEKLGVKIEIVSPPAPPTA